MNPKISIIIPTYNAEDYLLEAVDSIRNQTIGFENIELILVDDNSSDSTKSLLKELSQDYENIKTIFLEGNSGTASRPRNEGIKNASSDYVMFLDNDDIYYHDMCEVMYEAINSYDADVASCRYHINSVNSSKTPKSFLDKFTPYEFKDFNGEYDEESKTIYLRDISDFPQIMTLGHPTMIWTKIFKRSTILGNNIQFPEGDLYEDVYFTSKFYLHAKGIVILNDFWGYGYQLRTEGENKSTCQVFSNSLVEKQFRGFLKIMGFLKLENGKYKTLESELIIDMTKIYMYSDLTKDEHKKFLNAMKPFYKDYKVFTRVNTASLSFNLIINLFIKLFSFSNTIAIFSSNLFLKIKS